MPGTCGAAPSQTFDHWDSATHVACYEGPPRAWMARNTDRCATISEQSLGLYAVAQITFPW
jgi:hypothetical protein